jgi:hypothetical protein
MVSPFFIMGERSSNSVSFIRNETGIPFSKLINCYHHFLQYRVTAHTCSILF